MMLARESRIDVLRIHDAAKEQVDGLLSQFGLDCVFVATGEAIPGSHWGDDEAGLIANQVYMRDDTPLHSLLHETCHAILMGSVRRQGLHTDAGGSALEECAVCYLQLLLADSISPMSRERMFRDMDAWGYSFRMGSTEAWFEQDAEDARGFLSRWVKENSQERGVEVIERLLEVQR